MFCHFRVKRLMEIGIITQLKNKWWSEMDADITENEFIALTIDDVDVIFAPLLLGLLITLLTFCIERRAIIAYT